MMHALQTAPVGNVPSAVTTEWLASLRENSVDPGALLGRVAVCAKDFRDEFRATAKWTNPGTKPTFVHRHITHRRREIA